jgi:dUTP pyrophosphatase
MNHELCFTMLLTPITFIRAHPDAIIPTLPASFGDAGMDLATHVEVTVAPWSSTLVDTGLRFESLEDGYFIRLASRSGLALKHNIEVGAGTVDNGYRGNICVLLRNLSDTPVTLPAGSRIAQMIFTPYARPISVETADQVTDETTRGAGGFGSSGV